MVIKINHALVYKVWIHNTFLERSILCIKQMFDAPTVDAVISKTKTV